MSRSARSRAAKAGWITQRARARAVARQARAHAAKVKHGQRARERSERRLTPAQKAKRTREANRLLADLKHARRSAAARRGWETRRARARIGIGGGGGGGGGGGTDDGGGGGRGGGGYDVGSLDELEDFDPVNDDYDSYDLETSPDYEE